MSKDHNSEDEILGKAYDARLMRRLLGYIKPYKKYIIIAIIFNIVVAALGPVRPYLTKVAVDDYIVNGDQRTYAYQLFFWVY
jgi:ATP-binding cassette, subfamily B, multidrug efflux pump